MDFGPGLDEALLCARQIPANALDRIEREHALGILIRRVKVRPVVRGADFHEHSNDDSEESEIFGSDRASDAAASDAAGCQASTLTVAFSTPAKK